MEPHLTMQCNGDYLTVVISCSCGWIGENHQAASVADAKRVTSDAVAEGRAHINADHPELFTVR